MFLIPSASWAISQDWNASFAVQTLGRWFDEDLVATARHDFEVEPIVTLEYVLPAPIFSDRLARLLGRPAIDLQGSHLSVWSSAPGASYEQWDASLTLKMGWRF